MIADADMLVLGSLSTVIIYIMEQQHAGFVIVEEDLPHYALISLHKKVIRFIIYGKIHDDKIRPIAQKVLPDPGSSEVRGRTPGNVLLHQSNTRNA